MTKKKEENMDKRIEANGKSRAQTGLEALPHRNVFRIKIRGRGGRRGRRNNSLEHRPTVVSLNVVITTVTNYSH